MTPRPKRKPIPMHVKLEACLIKLGFAPGEPIDWDHSPPLGLRPVSDDGTDYDPPQHDPRHIYPLERALHSDKTNGNPAVALSGDKSRIAKAKRLEEKHAAFRDRLLEREIVFEDWSEPRRKRKIPSRPFEKR